MRLRGGPSEGVCSPSPAIEVVVTVKAGAVVLSTVVLPVAAIGGMLGAMPSLHQAGGAKVAPDERDIPNPPSESGPVAGCITPEETELAATVREWIDRNRKDWAASTAKEYASVVTRAIRECGWTRCADVSLANVTAYLDGKRTSGEWVGATHNRNLGAFKSLTKYMAMRELLAKNTLEHAESASMKDSGPGARAASTAEIRLLVKLAWARESTDRRAKGNRAIHRAMLALGGMRYEEPFGFRWRNYRRTDKVPLFWWESSMQKNGTESFIAVAPALVKLLEEHRARLLASGVTETVTLDRRNNTREIRRCDPNDPNAYILPYTSSTSRFSKDVELCKIQRHDWRGRRFSSHALRKWFETTLIDAGVQQRQVDYLMRHQTDVASRYYDAPLDAQVAALSKLPLIWPGEYADTPEATPANKTHPDSTKVLTDPMSAVILTQLLGSTQSLSDPSNGDEPRSLDGPSRPACGNATRGVDDAGPRPASSRPPDNLSSGIAHLELRTLDSTQREAVADLLDAGARLAKGPASDLIVALARLLREPGNGSQFQRKGTAQSA